MARGRKGKHRGTPPDDYFAVGPFEFARFGRLTVARSNISAEQFDAMQASMASRLPKVVAELDELVTQIADQIAHLPPEQLLHRAWWEFAASVIDLGGKNTGDSDHADAMRMIDYVQSVISAVKPAASASTALSDEDWIRLTTDVRTLFTRLSQDYQFCLTAYRKTQNPSLTMELEEFRFRAEVLWMNVRGERYQLHERQALIDSLTPHSDMLVRLFGIDASTLIHELDKILAKLTRGLRDAIMDMDGLREEILERLPKISTETGITDLDDLHRKIFKNTDLAARRAKIAGEVFGLDLFDVRKNTSLPDALLNELTWSPGEEEEFFSPGEYRGWPLRVWPTMKRPFIRINGRVLCFDMFALFDNFYRVLQRVIFRLAPDYKTTWNARQKAVSEELPFTYLERILPTAQILRPVYYRWRSGKGQAQWHESDGLLIYDDHLFVIEVKAGAFTYTSPATDLPAHIASLANLVRNPASQGSRFVDYLESAPEVPIADANHNEIGRLRRSKFRHITVCAVTLDAFTDLAARAQHLKKIGVDVGDRSVWVLSIDDLRVYADLFTNPLIFLHFVEQRMLAAHSELVDLNDELDHIGLYFAQNNYSQHASELLASQRGKLNFIGFRTAVDDYYSSLVHGEVPSLPTQEMPLRLAEIINFLATSSVPGRSKLASFLLNGAGDFRLEIATAIENQLNDNDKLGRVRPISTYGEMRLTLYSWSPSAPRDATAAVEHTQTVMIANGEISRPLIELEYSAQKVLTNVHWQHVGLAPLSRAELDRLGKGAHALKRRRIANAQSGRKIGANEQCPCGSGKKYKRCCRP